METKNKKPKKKKIRKTKRKLLNQTENQNNKNSIKINDFLNIQLRPLIDYNIRKFKNLFDSKLGMDEQDIRTEMMFEIWKGIVTHKKNKSANLKTYISTLISNRFKLLAKKCGAKKFSIITYTDFAGDNAAQLDQQNHYETGESLLEKRELVMSNLTNLSDTEKKVLFDLISGYNLSQMIERNSIDLPNLIRIIKKIDELMAKKKEEAKNARQ